MRNRRKAELTAEGKLLLVTAQVNALAIGVKRALENGRRSKALR